MQKHTSALSAPPRLYRSGDLSAAFARLITVERGFIDQEAAITLAKANERRITKTWTVGSRARVAASVERIQAIFSCAEALGLGRAVRIILGDEIV